MLSFLSNLFSQKPVVFMLSYDAIDRTFILRTEINGKPYPIKEALSRFNRLHFPIGIKGTGEAMPIKPQDVEAVRAWLQHLSNTVEEKYAVCRCDALPAALKRVDTPADFMLSFTAMENGISCTPQQGVTALAENGWFLSGSDIWHTAIGNTIALSLRSPVKGGQLAGLLSKDLPALLDSGIQVECPYRYDDAPYLSVTVKEVSKDSVSLERRMQTGELRPVSGTGDYWWDGNTLRPKRHDPLLERFFGQGDSVVLKGDDLPRLALAAGDTWKPFMKGEVQPLLEQHPVYESGELLLYGYSEQLNGIGKAYARAEVWTGNKRFSVAQLSRAILPESEFVQTDDGWFRIKLLEKLGLGRMGRLADGRSIDQPFALSAGELLSCGGDRLAGPWKRMAVENLRRAPAGKSLAYNHLHFLAEWGLSGGLDGCGAENMEALLELISELRRAAPQCRLLLVGKKQRLDEINAGLQPLSPLLLDGSKKDVPAQVQSSLIIMAAPNAVTKNEALQILKFDLLVLLEPDAMAKTGKTKIFTALNRLKARIRIAFYGDTDYKKRHKTRLAQHELIGISGNSAAGCLIINPDRPLPALPRPFEFKPAGLRKPHNFAEIEMQGEPAPHQSIPIPQRTAAPRAADAGSYPIISVSFRTMEQSFVEQAKEFSSKTLRHASFTPFMAYWPTYGSMTGPQLQWYFYWREKVRGGEYQPTDLSYIFLYVYELLNLVGCQSPADGYQKLMEVWRAYRVAFPKLDRYLADWVSDFVLVNGLGVGPDEISQLSGYPVAQDDLDRMLIAKFGERPLRIDVPLLARAANYDLTRSKFYQSAHSSLCDAYIPKAVTLVDAFLEKQQGRRIVEMFHPGYTQRERYLFRSALYAGEPRAIIVNAVSLSTHAPLRDFLAQVIRHTENKLREIKGYPGKLRGVELEEELRRLIDAYLDRELLKKQDAPPGITIDANKLASAMAEAEQTQRMLMTGNEEEKMGGERDGLPAEFALVKELLSQLDESESQVVQALLQNGWEMPNCALQAILPECLTEDVVDRINKKALGILGSLLIVQEGDLHVIDEDFRDELEYMEAHPAQEARAPAAWNAEGLDAKWRELCQKLSPCQLDILDAMAWGASQQDLRMMAERAETMIEPLLDSINDAAMDTIGDLLIEDGAILEEYMEPVKALFSAGDE